MIDEEMGLQETHGKYRPASGSRSPRPNWAMSMNPAAMMMHCFRRKGRIEGWCS